MEHDTSPPTPVDLGATVWVEHPSGPKGEQQPAEVLAGPIAGAPGGPAQPSTRVIRVRFADGQEQVLPEARVATRPPAP